MAKQLHVDHRFALTWRSPGGCRVFNSIAPDFPHYTDPEITHHRTYRHHTNNEPGSGEINFLWSIDLATGKAIRYDYFSDK